MITITLGEETEKISIPQAWNEICLGDYEKWFAIQPQNRLEETKLIARICNVDESTFLKNPTQLFDIVSDSLSFIFEDNKYEASNSIDIDGIKHSISFSDELTLAEWIDVEMAFDESKSQSKLSEILSILCRPKGEVYDSKKSEERKKRFADLSMDKVFPLLSFFLQRNEISETTSNLYFSIQDQIARYLRTIRDFAENGDGIKSLPIWQRIRFFFLNKYLQKQLSKYSDSFSIK